VAGLNIQLVEGDVRNLESLRSAFHGAEIVYHLAASISLESDNWSMMHATNVIGTRNVVEACLYCGVQRLVHVSSIHALEQMPFDTPIDESRPRLTAKKHPAYNRSKAAGEREIQRGITQGLDAVILNPTAIIGPNDFKPSYFGKALIALGTEKLPVLVKGGFNWVDVRDVVSGIMLAAQHAPTGASYLLSGHWRSIGQIAQIVATNTGVQAPRLTVPLGLAYIGLPFITLLAKFSGQEPLYTRFSLHSLKSNRQISHAHASHALGYRRRPIEETIADAIVWFKEHGYLNTQG
jgi:dihydroflavonol-4-reductase